MKPLDLFVVQIESRTQDTIKTASGLELYVDTKFDEFNKISGKFNQIQPNSNK